MLDLDKVEFMKKIKKYKEFQKQYQKLIIERK